MELIEDLEKLDERVLVAKNMLKRAKSAEERIALGNYLANLYTSIKGVSGEELYPSTKDVFGSNKNYQKFNKKVDIYEDRMINSYLQDKDFHKKYIGEILEFITEPLDVYGEYEFSEDKILTKGEFFDIFYAFLDSLKMDKKDIDKLKDMDFYSYEKGFTDDYRGYLIYNPINKNSDIFIGGFSYNIESLFTLAHEVGHAYDFLKFEDDVNTYNKYFYQSFYGETISKLFERLVVDYLVENNIYLGDSKEEVLAMEFDNYTNLIFSYIISMFDDETLKNHKQNKMSLDSIYEVIEKSFEENIIDIIASRDSLDIQENYVYTYGDIISMFLKEKVKEEDFNTNMFLDFLYERGNVFDKRYLEEYDMSPKEYVKLYKKELKLLEK